MTLKDLAVFADVKRVVVLAAHPDDLETMCGGTVAKLIAQGVEVISVNCTLGDIGTTDPAMTRADLVALRSNEAEAAAHVLGLKEVINLGHHDGELVPDLTLRAQVAQVYRQTQADTVFTFDPYNIGQRHPDHRAVGITAIDAGIPAQMPLYHPEQLQDGTAVSQVKRIFFFATDKPEILIDVTDVHDHKLAAARAHVCQFPQGDKDLEWLQKRDKLAGEKIGVTYAEQFREMRI